MSYSLETVDVVGSEEAVEINGVFSSCAHCAHVFFPLADHGPLQQAGALQGELEGVHPASTWEKRSGKITDVLNFA